MHRDRRLFNQVQSDGASVDILAETADLEERYRVHNTENSVDTAGDQDGLDWSGV